MKKLLAALVAGAFAVASVGVFAASHAGAQPMKDGKKDEMKKDDKKDEMKKDDKKK
jgi:Spy/CpxP family protein refolding chaperone